MAAAYDNYNYPSYWEGRDYEHESEVIALRSLLENVKDAGSILEIGSGFGRLVPVYYHRAKTVTLTDPSARLLKIAREQHKNDNKIKYIQTSLENINTKVKASSKNLVVMVRVLHHIENTDNAFEAAYRILKKGGYYILEYPNKRHLKAFIKEFIKGNITFALNIFPKDIRSKRSIKKRTLPFKNYHPDDIKKCLEDVGFEIVQALSVSNFRSSKAKYVFTKEVLLWLEKRLQRPCAKYCIGPSMFILAKKT